eukprot:TRINITY_DN3535_c0_g1_i1.p1 TRINITY_DN3535_c0_g1~~TRINITY_DN3535_c0_g1_i1.p1  ORF type:complete len:655 (+),score=125.16 TRINITY_DN3535_c0_g1_i1:196-1965(+)
MRGRTTLSPSCLGWGSVSVGVSRSRRGVCYVSDPRTSSSSVWWLRGGGVGVGGGSGGVGGVRSLPLLSLSRGFASSAGPPPTPVFNPEDEAKEPEEPREFDYDLLVIGGGSGGIAAAKEAGKLGGNVAVLDYVVPSAQNSVWGLGGTCVNVGCIPKKLMHQASLHGEGFKDSIEFGWEVDPGNLKHNWGTLVTNVQNHIKSLNFAYRNELRSHGVKYLNEYGKFIDAHTVECTNKRGEKVQRTAQRILIAVGERPFTPDVPGVEHAITSDDLFSMSETPGDTLVVGGGYVALETAGFLKGLGFNTSVMVRSEVLLRGFDRQMSSMLGDQLAASGVHFDYNTDVKSIKKLSSGRLKVTHATKQSDGTVTENTTEHDTVIFATGRSAHLDALHLERAGVQVGSKKAKIVANDDDETTSPSVFAVGDCVLGRPELTPTAIMAGKYLARRMFKPSAPPQHVQFSKVATTVFTPLEYAFVGLSEEDAMAKVGKHAVEVYHAHFQPLEFRLGERNLNDCYLKIICDREDNERVLGIHILSPNAGEIMQGYAVAYRMNATKEDLDTTVGIHPTIAEELNRVTITKSSGLDPVRTGC